MKNVEADVAWIDKLCLSKKGVEKDFKVEWQWTRYMVKAKLFVAIGVHKDGRPIVSMKCDPMFNQLMREQHEDIIPGYYMNKEHWNSIYLDGNVPNSLIEEMIDQSYSLVLKSLTKKQQAEIEQA